MLKLIPATKAFQVININTITLYVIHSVIVVSCVAQSVGDSGASPGLPNTSGVFVASNLWLARCSHKKAS